MRTLEEKRAYSRNRAKLRRMTILLHYSKSKIPFCQCCGENEIKFLVLDHTNGGGTKHRMELGKGAGGTVMYNWIIKNDFPDGFQVLCHNCNQAKSFYNECPHKI